MTKLDGKIALVTGGRSGIGKAIADRLSAEGAHVITVQRRAGDTANAWSADLTNPSAAEEIISRLKEEYGQLDILVNNAGMMTQTHISALSLDDWQESIALNLTAPYLLIKQSYDMLAASQGVIVNIGSIEGLAANPEHAAYVASKAGLAGLTKAVAVDAGAAGIRCHTVAPGWIDTELNNAFIAAREDSTAFLENIARIHPIGRTGGTDEVAALVAFLASDEARFITGQTYVIDGGRMAKLPLP